ncbi:MAG: hypothetical protein OET55_05470, partial [Desulfuromonadales bacterium]|nr:hypothetical protein [Desulfuromonadales bacterium]
NIFNPYKIKTGDPIGNVQVRETVNKKVTHLMFLSIVFIFHSILSFLQVMSLNLSCQFHLIRVVSQNDPIVRKAAKN